MPFQPDSSQQAALAQPGSRLIVGLPGSGKTEVLMACAEQAVAAGIPASRVALTTFSFRAQEVLRTLTRTGRPELAASLTFQPLKDWILPVLRAGGNDMAEASNNDVRRLLRILTATQALPGSLEEAENIIRAAKGRARKLPENDRFYPFYTAYNALLKERNLIDRQDIFRLHLLGMRNKSLPPLPLSHLLVDHIQDATELQLMWLKEHLNAGITLVMAGTDDLTAFGTAGAQGPQAIALAQSWPGVATQVLSQHYRSPAALVPALEKVARFLTTRSSQGKGGAALNTVAPSLVVQASGSPADERRWIAAEATAYAAKGHSVGIITHDDFSANVIGHLLRKQGQASASYARLIWEDPVPQTVLAMLSLLLNRATPQQLVLVLVGLGLPADQVRSWVGQGLTAENWLANGAPLPLVEDASPTLVARTAHIRRALLQAWDALTRRLADPRTVFLACVNELLHALPGDMSGTEDPPALLATDMLLSLKGNLAEVLPRVTQETLPDMAAAITVAPVREVRNLEFEVVFIAGLNAAPHPHAWPAADAPTRLLPVDADHERRLFYLAATRTRQHLILTHSGPLSPFAADLQQAFRRNRPS